MDTDEIPNRWKDIYTFLERTGPFAAEGFEPGDEVIQSIVEHV